MPVVHTFSWQMDEDFGDEGWVPDWFPGANIVKGDFAHDVLEHHKSTEDGSVASEFRAFGSMIWLRIEPGLEPAYRENSFAEEVYSLATDAFCAVDDLDAKPCAWIDPSLVKRSLKASEWAESLFDKVLITDKFRESIARSLGYYRCSETFNDSLSDWVDKNLTPAHLQAIRRLLRQGYHRAFRRFGGDINEASALYTRISTDPLTAIEGGYHQTLRLSVDFKNYTHSIKFIR